MARRRVRGGGTSGAADHVEHRYMAPAPAPSLALCHSWERTLLTSIMEGLGLPSLITLCLMVAKLLFT